MNLPRIPDCRQAHFAGLVLRAYLTRLIAKAPALARAFLRGLSAR